VSGQFHTAVEERNKESLKELERRIQELSAALVRANAELRKEMDDRRRLEDLLRATNRKYRTLFEGSKDVVFISSPEGKFLDINSAGVELYCYSSKEELLKIDVTRDLYVDPRERDRFQEELARSGFVKEFEMTLKRKDGQHLIVLETAIAVHDDHGKVIAYQGITRDITERKRAEEALKQARLELERRVQERTAELAEANWALSESEEQYRKLFEESQDAIYITTRDGKILGMNQFALDLFNYTKEELSGLNVAMLYTNPKDREKFQGQIEQKGYVRNFSVQMRKKGGSTIDCLLTSTIRRGADRSVLGYQGIIRDITEQKRADQEILDSRQRLREFSSRLQSVREEEKRKIAGEIHDELGQVLTGLKLDLSSLRKLIASGQSKSGKSTRKTEEAIPQRIQSMSALLDTAVQTVRRISRELRPTVLEHLGLLGTLEWQAHEFETRTGIPCTVSSELQEFSLHRQDQAIAVFRIVQEALTNVVRHAKATEVKVRLAESNSGLLLQIADNGVGFQVGEGSEYKSFGLVGMRERALLLGGRIVIESAPGKGTTINLHIPKQPTP